MIIFILIGVVISQSPSLIPNNLPNIRIFNSINNNSIINNETVVKMQSNSTEIFLITIEELELRNVSEPLNTNRDNQLQVTMKTLDDGQFIIKHMCNYTGQEYLYKKNYEFMIDFILYARSKQTLENYKFKFKYWIQCEIVTNVPQPQFFGENNLILIFLYSMNFVIQKLLSKVVSSPQYLLHYNQVKCTYRINFQYCLYITLTLLFYSPILYFCSITRYKIILGILQICVLGICSNSFKFSWKHQKIFTIIAIPLFIQSFNFIIVQLQQDDQQIKLIEREKQQNLDVYYLQIWLIVQDVLVNLVFIFQKHFNKFELTRIFDLSQFAYFVGVILLNVVTIVTNSTDSIYQITIVLTFFVLSLKRQRKLSIIWHDKFTFHKLKCNQQLHNNHQ